MLNTARKQHRIRLDNLERLVARRARPAPCQNVRHQSLLRQPGPPSASPPPVRPAVGDDLAALSKSHGKPDDGWTSFTPERIRSRQRRADPAHRRAPLISWVQAGTWTDAADSFSAHDAEAWLPCPVRCSPDTFVLRVRGESMEPRFRDGDLIFVDPAVSPDHGRFVVVREKNSHEATFRQLIVEGEQKYLKALNPDWPVRIVERNSTASICGVVVFKGEIV